MLADVYNPTIQSETLFLYFNFFYILSRHQIFLLKKFKQFLVSSANIFCDITLPMYMCTHIVCCFSRKGDQDKE